MNALVQADVQQSEYLSYFDKFDILSIIFETGLLGKVSMVRTVDAKGIEQFGTDKSIKIINALFEYQYKGNLKKNKEYDKIRHKIEEIKNKYPRVREFFEDDKIEQLTKKEMKAILDITELQNDRAMYEADEMLKIGLREGKAL